MKMVERMARAICCRNGCEVAGATRDDAGGIVPVCCSKGFEADAIAVLHAMRDPNETMVEEGCRAAYGKHWDGPADKAPGEQMKEVWRGYPKKIWPGMIDAAIREAEAE